jgi:hypothetical protein
LPNRIANKSKDGRRFKRIFSPLKMAFAFNSASEAVKRFFRRPTKFYAHAIGKNITLNINMANGNTVGN